MGHRSKQNGHPVSVKGISFFTQEKTYPKEACDVRTHYSILFSLSSNQNYQSVGFTRCQRISCSDSTRQALSTDLSWLRSKSLRCAQLGRTHRTGSEHGYRTRVDPVSVPQAALPAVPGHPYRGFAAVSPIFAGDDSISPLYLSTVPNDDRLGSLPAPGAELENGQRHRQILLGARLQSTAFKRSAHFGRRRNLNPKRPSLSNRCIGLSDRPRGICWQRSQSQNAAALLQSVRRKAARWHQGRGYGYVGSIHQGR